MRNIGDLIEVIGAFRIGGLYHMHAGDGKWNDPRYTNKDGDCVFDDEIGDLVWVEIENE